jgi:two-component system NtrC family sensor kinase
LALEVSDSGPGVPPEIASRLFDPFFTTKPMGLGTGLGLSIAYGIIQDHGGDIYPLDPQHSSATTAPLGGATLVVELPVFNVVETPAAEPTLLEAHAHSTLVDGPELIAFRQGSAEFACPPRARILVVEDEPTVAQLIADVLQEDGHVVDIILDSREGLARAGRLRYDLIICDLRMPIIDGRAFYRSLVRSGHHAHPRILFVTGDTLAPRTLDFLNETGLPCLAKPFLVEELKSMVDHALNPTLSPDQQFSASPTMQDFDPFSALVPHSDAAPSPSERRDEEVRKP